MRDLSILLIVIMYYLLCIRYCMILLFVVPKGDAILGFPSSKVTSNPTDIPDPLPYMNWNHSAFQAWKGPRP